MKSTWNLKEDSQGELLVEVTEKIWKDAQEKAFDKIAKDIEIDGFRKGTAPKNLVEKQVKEEKVLFEAMEALVQEALTFGLTENKITPVAKPNLDVKTLDKEKVVYQFLVTVSPEVILGEYKNLGIKPKAVKVTAEEVSNKLEELKEKHTELVLVERASKLEDTVVIDFEGFKDDVAFEGGKAENYSLLLGSNSFIPGFEDQLVGLKAGEEKEVVVTFPKEYQASDLAGKEAVFKVKVHEVKEKVLPELNDDFAKDVNYEGVETLKDLEKYLKKEIKEHKEMHAQEEANGEIFDKVTTDAKVKIPEVMIEEEINHMVNDFKQRLQQQGLDFEQYTQMTGQKEEELRQQMQGDADKRVRLRLVLDAIAEKEGIQATDDEIEAEYQMIAQMYQLEVEKVKELIGLEAISGDLKLRKAYDLVLAS